MMVARYYLPPVYMFLRILVTWLERNLGLLTTFGLMPMQALPEGGRPGRSMGGPMRRRFMAKPDDPDSIIEDEELSAEALMPAPIDR